MSIVLNKTFLNSIKLFGENENPPTTIFFMEIISNFKYHKNFVATPHFVYFHRDVIVFVNTQEYFRGICVLK